MGELRALTSLRGLAALYVVLLHFSSAIEKHCVGTIPALAPRGHLAVDFFFVLSGFIMAYSYAQEFAQRGVRKALPSFLIKRVARVMPLHWAMTFAILIYTLLISPGFAGGEPPAFNTAHPVRDVVLNFFLLQGVGFAPNMNGPSWSISVEMFAYFAFPALLFLFFNRVTAVRWAAIAVAVLGLILTSLQRSNLSLDTLALPVGWTIVRGFTEFSLGIVAYRVFSTGFRANLIGSDRFVLFVFLIAASMMLLRLWDLIAVLAFPAIILGTALNRGVAKKLLENRRLHTLGVISFSLYLIHYPVAYLELQVLRYLHPDLLSKPAALFLAAVGAFSTIPLAWLTYLMVEHPGRSVIRAMAERMKMGRN